MAGTRWEWLTGLYVNLSAADRTTIKTRFRANLAYFAHTLGYSESTDNKVRFTWNP